MLAHLQALTWRFSAEGQRVWAIAPYSEPVQQPDGSVQYGIRRAAESGDEGLACVDDAARAVLLALAVSERAGREESREARQWAERWLTLVRYMQLPDGRFVNFVYDETGRRNLEGRTSAPGGLWWTGRALWALARYQRMSGSSWALEAWARCPLPDLGEACNTQALFALAGIELLKADARVGSRTRRALLESQQARGRGLVIRCCEAIVASGPDYFRDHPGRASLPLWGYHQLHAVARAAEALGREDFVGPCVATVDHLIGRVVAVRGLAWYDPATGGSKQGITAYCLSSITQGLATLYDVTGEGRYRDLALEAAAWLYGRNDAHAVLYDPATGRCSDGLDGPAWDQPSANSGAEASIEAGFMELERRRLSRRRETGGEGGGEEARRSADGRQGTAGRHDPGAEARGYGRSRR